MRWAYHVARGEKLCGRDVERGPVIYLAGENPDDVDNRCHGLCHAEGVNPNDLDVYMIAGAGNITTHAEQIKNTCRADNMPMVIVREMTDAGVAVRAAERETMDGLRYDVVTPLTPLSGMPRAFATSSRFSAMSARFAFGGSTLRQALLILL